MVPTRTPHYRIYLDTSVPPRTLYYIIICLFYQIFFSILKFDSTSRYLEANLRESWGRALGVFSAVYTPLILLDSDFNDII